MWSASGTAAVAHARAPWGSTPSSSTGGTRRARQGARHGTVVHYTDRHGEQHRWCVRNVAVVCFRRHVGLVAIIAAAAAVVVVVVEFIILGPGIVWRVLDQAVPWRLRCCAKRARGGRGVAGKALYQPRCAGKRRHPSQEGERTGRLSEFGFSSAASFACSSASRSLTLADSDTSPRSFLLAAFSRFWSSASRCLRGEQETWVAQRRARFGIRAGYRHGQARSASGPHAAHSVWRTRQWQTKG